MISKSNSASYIPVLPVNYLPDIHYFYLGHKYGTILLEVYENFQKNSFRNRAEILSANGPLTLSVPLKKGKNTGMPIQNVTIAYDMPWHKKHWQAIRSAYANAPYWEHYEPYLEGIFVTPGSSLFDFNYSLLKLLIRLLGLKINIQFTDKFEAAYPEERFLDLRNIQAYNLFKSVNPVPSYEQVFSDKFEFQAGLSALDVLMCQGPYACEILSAMNQATV